MKKSTHSDSPQQHSISHCYTCITSYSSACQQNSAQNLVWGDFIALRRCIFKMSCDESCQCKKNKTTCAFYSPFLRLFPQSVGFAITACLLIFKSYLRISLRNQTFDFLNLISFCMYCSRGELGLESLECRRSDILAMPDD